MRLLYFFTLLVVIFPPIIRAQVFINEISPLGDEEWVEIYNAGETPFDLAGWCLADGNTVESDDLTLEGIITPLEFKVFTHNKGWLNDGGDSVTLLATDSATIDTVAYGTVPEGKSWARVPDGSPDWLVSDLSKGLPNPTPAPPPTPTPTPSPSPTPTPSPTPSSAPSPTPTPTPTPSPAPGVEGEVLSASTSAVKDLDLSVFLVDLASPSASASALPVPSTNLNYEHLSNVLFIGVGLTVSGLSGVFITRRLTRKKL